MSKLEPILFIPDTHVPYHDKRAFELVLKVGKALKPKHLIVLGDFGDFYAVSAHDKNPERAQNLSYEVEEINKALDKLDSLGASNKQFIEGNHENRLERYLQTEAPELFDMVKVDKLFALKERGWKYTPYKSHSKIGKLYLTHDTGKAGATAHTAALNDFQDNVVIGHTHRLAYTVTGNAKGIPHVAAMFGWLGDANQADYMHRIKAMRDWALGFGYGYLEPATGNVYLVPVPIVNYGCVVNGKKVQV